MPARPDRAAQTSPACMPAHQHQPKLHALLRKIKSPNDGIIIRQIEQSMQTSSHSKLQKDRLAPLPAVGYKSHLLSWGV